METFWRTSAVGAELVQVSSSSPKDEKVLGAVEIAHGYCFPWAINGHGNKILLTCRFSEKIEESKADVEKYLTEKGLLTELNQSDEKAA
jgi:hypothetical protein